MWFPGLVVHYWLTVVPSVVGHSASINISLVNLVRVLTHTDGGVLVWLATLVAGAAVLFPLLLAFASPQLGLHGTALLITGTAIFGPLVEHHHLVWLLLPIWFLFHEFLNNRSWLGISLSLAAFGLFSQPFRLGRVIEGFTPLGLPSGTLQGGSFLTLGTLVTYALLATVALGAARNHSLPSGRQTT